MVKQPRMYSENLDSQAKNGSFCENDGFSVVYPALGLQPALSADKIGFCCETGCMVVKQDSPTWYYHSQLLC